MLLLSQCFTTFAVLYVYCEQLCFVVLLLNLFAGNPLNYYYVVIQFHKVCNQDELLEYLCEQIFFVTVAKDILMYHYSTVHSMPPQDGAKS